MASAAPARKASAAPVADGAPKQTPARPLPAARIPASPHRNWNTAYEAARGGGRPLDAESRGYFEGRFGYGLESVRIHADGRGAEAARSVGARAYTLGHHIVFAAGEFAPHSAGGRQLLAHELAHTIQQSRGGGARPGFSQESQTETGARQAASAAISAGQGVVPVAGAASPGIAREARSLIGTVTPSRLSDEELQDEVLQVNTWLQANALVDNERVDHMTESLKRLEAEVNRRRAPKRAPAKVRQPLLPTVTGGGEDLERAMKVIDGIEPSTDRSNAYTMRFEGRQTTLTQAELDALRGRTVALLNGNVRHIENESSNATDSYDRLDETNRKHYLVAPIVQWWGNVEDPGPYLKRFAESANAAAASARSAIQAGHFAEAASLMTMSERYAIQANRMYQAYFAQTISAGEMTVTHLGYVRDTAFVLLALLATFATGGAAAGAAGLAEGGAGATILGVDVAVSTTAVNAIAIGAPIVASIGEAAAKVAMGDEVDWGELVLNIAVTLFLAKFGGKMTEGATRPLIAKLGPMVASKAMKFVVDRAVKAVVMHVGSTVLTTAVNDVYAILRGKEVTWGLFLDQVLAQLTDPKSAAIAALVSVVAHSNEYRLANGGAGGTGSAPKGAAAPPEEPAKPAVAAGEPPASARPATPAKPADAAPRPAASVEHVAASEPAATALVPRAAEAAPVANTGKPAPARAPRKPRVRTPPAAAPVEGDAPAAAAPKARKPRAASKPAPAPAVAEAPSPATTPAPAAAAKPLRDMLPQHQYSRTVDPETGMTYHVAEGPRGRPGEVVTYDGRSGRRSVSAGTGDDAGHLISRENGGSDRRENLTPQNHVANESGTWRDHERARNRTLAEGYDIHTKVTDTTRPNEDRPFYRKDEWRETAPTGETTEHSMLFANPHTPESRAARGIPPTTDGNQTGNVIPGNFRPAKPAAAPPEPSPADAALLKRITTGAAAANDNVRPPPKTPNAGVLPVPEEMPLKMAAGDGLVHTTSATGGGPVASANGGKPPSKPPQLQVVKPPASPGPTAGSAQGSVHAPPGSAPAAKGPARRADPVFEQKLDQALDSVKPLNLHAAIAQSEISVERDRSSAAQQLGDVGELNPALRSNMEAAMQSLNNKALWKRVLLRIHAELPSIGAKPSSMKQTMETLQQGATPADAVQTQAELDNLHPHTEAIWNVAEQTYGSPPQVALNSTNFATHNDPSSAPWGKPFYDADVATDTAHGASGHLLQELVITEGFKASGSSYTAEQLRNDFRAMGPRLSAANKTTTMYDLWNLVFDGNPKNGYLNNAENVSEMVRKVFPGVR